MRPLSSSFEIIMPEKKKKKSILSLGGIAKDRKVGIGKEREFAKKVVLKRIAREGV